MKKRNSFLFATLIGVIIGAGTTFGLLGKSGNKIRELSDKHLELYLMMKQWVKVKQKGKSLSLYFEKAGYKKIAIYGMSYAGISLTEELKNTSIDVLYGVDINAENIISDIKVITPDEPLEKVDAIVVTAIFAFSVVKKMLSEKIDCPIISLEDIVFSL